MKLTKAQRAEDRTFRDAMRDPKKRKRRKKPGKVNRATVPWSFCPLCGVKAPRPGLHKDGCPAYNEDATPSDVGKESGGSE